MKFEKEKSIVHYVAKVMSNLSEANVELKRISRVVSEKNTEVVYVCFSKRGRYRKCGF